MILNEFFNLPQVFEKDMEEGIFGSKPSPVLPIVAKIDKVARELNPQNVEVGKQIIQSQTRDITRILSPQAKAGVDVIEQDELEEVDRRGFLKGLGAAAVAGAAGYELGKPNLDNSVYKNPKAVFLIGYLHAAKEYMPRDRETLEINSIIEDYLAYTKGNAMDLHSGSSKFFNDVGAYNRQHKIGRPGYTEVFDDDVEQKKWIQSQGREALNQLKGLAQTKESVNQGVAEAKGDYVPPREADYGPEYQAMVRRVGQKAKQQEKAKQQQPKAPVRESRLALLKQIIQS